MATQSLFGPSAEEIMYQQQKDERDRQAQEFYQGLGAIDVPGVRTGMVFGRGIGRGLSQVAEGIFGSQAMEDPALAKATISRQIFSKYGASALNDPRALEAMANEFAAMDMPNEAIQLTQMAADLRSKASKQYAVKTGAELREMDPIRYSGVYPSHRYKVSSTGEITDMTPSKALPQLQAGEIFLYDEDPTSDTFGEITGVTAMPGSKLDLERKAAELAQKSSALEAMGGTANVLRTIQDTRETVSNYWYALGLPARLLQTVGWTSKADRVRANVGQIRSNLGLDQIQKLKSMSPTGSTGLGQVSNIELNALQSAIALLDQNMTEEDFLYQLDKIEQAYTDLVKRLGEDAIRLELEDSPELKQAYIAAGLLKPTGTGTDLDGSSGPRIRDFRS
jgi:hypothetical protein